jgi:hypothetical protein
MQDQDEEHQPFKFVDSLGKTPLGDERCVRSVIFWVSRYGKHKQRLAFSHRVSKKRAIEEAEKFLSRPIDLLHWVRVQDDSLDYDLEHHHIVEAYHNMGGLLGDARFLEIAELKGDVLTLYCGS